MNTKEFSIFVSLNRDIIIIKKFISSGDNIFTDGWSLYRWPINEGYHYLEFNHGRNSWVIGEESTSHSQKIFGMF